MSITLELPEITNLLYPMFITTAYSSIGFLLTKNEKFDITKFLRVILLSFITALGLNIATDVPSDVNTFLVPVLSILEEQFVKRFQDNNNNGIRDDVENELCEECKKKFSIVN